MKVDKARGAKSFTATNALIRRVRLLGFLTLSVIAALGYFYLHATWINCYQSEQAKSMSLCTAVSSLISPAYVSSLSGNTKDTSVKTNSFLK
jgi:hypothetical protein